MDKKRQRELLNEAINGYLAKKCYEAGNTRYWPKEYVTEDMMNDENLVTTFVACFSTDINITKEAANGAGHKEIDVGSLSGKSRRTKGT